MRIGHGFDVHRFVADRPLILGGVNIPYERGLEAHSDGDAVIHALCDALLGAMALGDIGTHFPDDDSRYENIDSRVLLRRVVDLLQERDYVLANADVTIIAQEPKLVPFIGDMCLTLSGDMRVPAESINIKATTTERLGFTGKKKGLAVHAVVLIRTINTPP